MPDHITHSDAAFLLRCALRASRAPEWPEERERASRIERAAEEAQRRADYFAAQDPFWMLLRDVQRSMR